MSASTTYLTTCPQCGAQLSPIAWHPDYAPWGCYECHLGFWVAELSHQARKMYRPLLNDWGFSKEAWELRDTVLAEREVARARGTSTLPEHIGMLPKEHIKQISTWNLSDDFKKILKGKA